MLYKFTVIMMLAMVCSVFCFIGKSTAQDNLLFSYEDAARLNLDAPEWEHGFELKSKELDENSKGNKPKRMGFHGKKEINGPKIVFDSPIVRHTEKGPVFSAPSTFDLVLYFEDEVAPVDMDSLKVEASKGWFSKDLTDKIRPYLRGQSVQANQLKVPSGRFKLELFISDIQGHESSMAVLCEISED